MKWQEFRNTNKKINMDKKIWLWAALASISWIAPGGAGKSSLYGRDYLIRSNGRVASQLKRKAETGIRPGLYQVNGDGLHIDD